MAATAAVPAQTASPSRHVPRAFEIGTVLIGVLVRPIASAVVYTAVIRPTRFGKCSLTSEGSSTFAIAIPASAGMLAAMNGHGESSVGRTARPRTTRSSAPRMVRCSPTRRANQGAKAPNRAKHSTGSVVSKPAAIADMPRSVRISASTGAMLTAAGRRLNPSSTIATAMRI